jgi:hypothetical protein
VAPIAAQEDGEYQLKAAFVSKFPEFTEWPADILDGRPSVDLCVVAPNPLGGALQELVAGESLRGKPFAVREVRTLADVDGCQLLFVPDRPAIARKALLDRAAKLPVLTVGESAAFLDEGGIVNLRMVGGRVRFEVSMIAANRANIRLSSQLLRLALQVRGGPS